MEAAGQRTRHKAIHKIIGDVSMGAVLGILLIASIATVSGALAIPFGIALGLEPFVVYATTTATAIGVTWLLLLGGNRVRTFAADRFGHDEHSVQRADGFIARYGSIGFGLVGPVLPGVVVSVLSGIAIGIESKHLGWWMTFGIAVWFGFFTAVWTAVRYSLVG